MVYFLGTLAMALAFMLVVAGCDDGNGGNGNSHGNNGGNGNSHGNLTYSIQVKNQGSTLENHQAVYARSIVSPSIAPTDAARSIAPTDKVELYIENFEYCEDANNRALILVADGDRDNGSKGGIVDNADWYSANADLAVENDVNPGPYSSFQVRITGLKVNGTEYPFPSTSENPDASVFFGHPTSRWNGGNANYPNNFSGITIDDETVSLKTILTVEPGILVAAGTLATDPYSFIKVEGRVNE
jgi:hypothetical protein